jgi:arylsulfatase A-like enzyme
LFGLNEGTLSGDLSRRTFLGAPAVALHQAVQRPNILWLCTDQQRFDTIGALGNSRIRTPNIDRLAASGAAFQKAYCQSPICTPSRASFLTGCYPSTLHVHRNGNAYFPKEATERLVTRILARHGYDCGLVGKLHLQSCQDRPEPRVDDGYRVFLWSHTPQSNAAHPLEAEAYQRWLRRQGVDWKKAFGAVRLKGWSDEHQPGIAAKYDQSTWCANEAIAFLSEKRSSPWLMSVNMFGPHPFSAPPAPDQPPPADTGVPFSRGRGFHAPPEKLERMNLEEMPLPLFQGSDLETQQALREVAHQTTRPRGPSEYPARQMMAAYYASIEMIDDQVGRVLDALERTGQRENTLVIFTSDHGEMLGDHGLFAKGCRFYEGAVHVPLLFSWPARFRPGLRSSALVELTDIVPTLLDAVGIPPPDSVQGQSLLRILTGEADPSLHRPFVRSEYHDALLVNAPKPTHANMFFDGRWKLVTYHGVGGELYDSADDPHEFRNRWQDPACREVKAGLTARLFDALMLATDFGQPRLASH